MQAKTSFTFNAIFTRALKFLVLQRKNVNDLLLLTESWVVRIQTARVSVPMRMVKRCLKSLSYFVSNECIGWEVLGGIRWVTSLSGFNPRVVKGSYGCMLLDWHIHASLELNEQAIKSFLICIVGIIVREMWLYLGHV